MLPELAMSGRKRPVGFPFAFMFLEVTMMTAPLATATEVTLVRDGAPLAANILPADPHADETEAAQELALHVRKMSGATLEIVEGRKPPKTMLPIYLGRAADAGLEALIRKKGAKPGSFALVVTEAAVSIRGLSPEGTLFGVYELLEQLGVRWFMPGEFGTVIPERRDISLPQQTTVQVPSFKGRHLQIVDLQCQRRKY